MPPFLTTLRALDAKATPAPWDMGCANLGYPPVTTVIRMTGDRLRPVSYPCESGQLDDAKFIVLLRNHAARIAALVEAAQAVADRPLDEDANITLRAALAALES